MGMTAIVQIADKNVKIKHIQEVFTYFDKIDMRFSTFKKTSEVSLVNAGTLKKKDYSPELKKILKLSELTKKQTMGYFNIYHKNKLDPSGIVKGYAIFRASNMLIHQGYKNFTIEIGGDIEIRGKKNNKSWRVGIRNPFKTGNIVKVLYLTDCGIATSGSYTKGAHIFDVTGKITQEVASITVIGPNVYEADRMATAAYAMGRQGIEFIEGIENLEGYMIDQKGIATLTSGFGNYTRETQKTPENNFTHLIL